MKKTTTALVLAIGAVTIGISVASPAGADPSNCQQIGSTTVCGHGGNRGQPAAPAPGAGPRNCTNAYGSYQNCGNAGGGSGL
jgi:hypothetical protein